MGSSCCRDFQSRLWTVFITQMFSSTMGIIPSFEDLISKVKFGNNHSNETVRIAMIDFSDFSSMFGRRFGNLFLEHVKISARR